MRLRAVMVAAIVIASSALAAAGEPKLYAMVYPAADLPVFRLAPGGAKFDPSLLVAQIKRMVDPPSWTEGDAGISIYKDNLSVVITQTAENHKRLRELLDSLRKN